MCTVIIGLKLIHLKGRWALRLQRKWQSIDQRPFNLLTHTPLLGVVLNWNKWTTFDHYTVAIWTLCFQELKKENMLRFPWIKPLQPFSPGLSPSTGSSWTITALTDCFHRRSGLFECRKITRSHHEEQGDKWGSICSIFILSVTGKVQTWLVTSA